MPNLVVSWCLPKRLLFKWVSHSCLGWVSTFPLERWFILSPTQSGVHWALLTQILGGQRHSEGQRGSPPLGSGLKNNLLRAPSQSSRSKLVLLQPGKRMSRPIMSARRLNKSKSAGLAAVFNRQTYLAGFNYRQKLHFRKQQEIICMACICTLNHTVRLSVRQRWGKIYIYILY